VQPLNLTPTQMEPFRSLHVISMPSTTDWIVLRQSTSHRHGDRDESTSVHVRLPGGAHAAACATAAGPEPGTGHF
jgi:hypothetical protein